MACLASAASLPAAAAADDPQTPAEAAPSAPDEAAQAAPDAPASAPTDAGEAAPLTAAPASKTDAKSQFHGSIELDNQYSVDTKPLRATLALSYTDLFSQTDELSAAYQLAPQDVEQVSVFATNYTAHPLPGGFQPAVYFIDANTNVPTAEAGGVVGKGQIVGLRISHALTSAAVATQTLSLALEYKHFRNSPPFESLELEPSTPISYPDLVLAYAGNWNFGGNQSGVNVAASYGPHGGANAAGAYAEGDFHARSDYFALRADSAILAALPKGWRFYARLAGQYTRDSLNVDEEYSVAGVDAVRGYLEAEVLGDRALKGTLQLQSPVWQRATRQIGDAFVFCDAGVAQMLQTVPGETMTMHPRSWGLGVDLLAWKHLSGALTWARPWASADVTHAGETRLLFLMRASF
jgi:hemolysin activation/secretion protein